MVDKRLPQYKGPLTAAQVADGINVAISNAQQLADAAALLLENGHNSVAASLAALSIEETGKIPILRSLSLARDSEEVTQAWREYRSHTKKNVMWIFTQLFAIGARRLDDFGPLFEKDADHSFLLDQIKQLGLYTDCLGKAHWSIPQEVIDDQLAKALVTTAGILASKKGVTEKEIELWIQYIKPVWKGPKEHMEAALVSWYAAMQENGLMPEGDNEMEQFIIDGLSIDSQSDIE